MEKAEKLFLLQENETRFLREIGEFLERLIELYGQKEAIQPSFFRMLEQVELKVVEFISLLQEKKLADYSQQPTEVRESLQASLQQIFSRLYYLLLQNTIYLKNYSRLNREVQTWLEQINGENYNFQGKVILNPTASGLEEEV